MNTDTLDYGCLMGYPFTTEDKRIIASFIKQNIPETVLVEEGHETDSHVTVLYGFHLDIPVKEIYKASKYFMDGEQLSLSLGNISRFENEAYDVIKVDIESDDLVAFNAFLREEFENRVDVTFPIYHPHITLAYVQKGACRDLDGKKIDLKNNEFYFDDLIYSISLDGQGKKYRFNV